VVHAPEVQAWPAMHAVVQLPQCAASVIGFTHAPLHVVVPDGHIAVHTALEQ
jgi:hypothetical protein